MSYVDALVRRSPANVTTKKSGKQLPLELWHQILDCGSSTERPNHRHEYALVQPQWIEMGKHGSTLVCFLVQDRMLCGTLEDAYSVDEYESYLKDPSAHNCYATCPCHCEPEDHDDLGDRAIQVPAIALDSRISILYQGITVPDVISWVERGSCHLCGGNRLICCGCGDGRRARQCFISWDIPGDCGVTMFCPLCIGLDFAEEGLTQMGEEYGGNPAERMTDEEYDRWSRGRLRELGY
ncbi:hypothetical protein SPI_05945 [Niveomyces insectorum RCEF 264]|uniref:Uncharacterized protein n=1 Tax=Niveomyces insectorum RCEF 264 TaxID=1081102 RepID=A0A167SM06_9HYPO|nr:hypothetical protein SPI_05945 [Niveomyces insectorum RCEF 264]